MSDVYTEALELHAKLKGKIEVTCKVEVDSKEELSIVYSPGVAKPCLEINDHPEKVYDYTWKQNTVVIVSDSSAVLGLGKIAPAAGLPVMEGKAMLFKRFADINAVPLCVDCKSADEIVDLCVAIAPTFGAIHLEDIKAPECVYIERKLQEKLDIPVFHDDQHGTAIVALAGLINAAKLVKKDLKDLKVVVSGVGAAGSAIIRILYGAGIRKISAFNLQGNIIKSKRAEYNPVVAEMCDYVSDTEKQSMQEALVGADVFIGVSAGDILKEADVQSMAKDAIVFALANPTPEIDYNLAKKAGARVVATGRSDYPNQVNNVLAFPGLFKGALSVKASKINEEMKIASAVAIASLITDQELADDYVVPSSFDGRVAEVVAAEVRKVAIETGVARID